MKSTNKEKEARLVYLERAPNYHYMAWCVDWLMHESWLRGKCSMIMKDNKAFAYLEIYFQDFSGIICGSQTSPCSQVQLTYDCVHCTLYTVQCALGWWWGETIHFSTLHSACD
jgi:hypothetical protein